MHELHSPLNITTPPLSAHLEDIMPQRSPTMLRPISLAFSDLSVSDTSSLTEDFVACSERRKSEAAPYLAQFRSGTWSGQSTVVLQRHIPYASIPTEGIPSLMKSGSPPVSTAALTAASRPLPPRHDKSFSAFGARTLDILLPEGQVQQKMTPA